MNQAKVAYRYTWHLLQTIVFYSIPNFQCFTVVLRTFFEDLREISVLGQPLPCKKSCISVS